jgi:tetratricopeptide (TPR) repeat protein
MYEKAISLNPLNYEDHLKLGWFYANKGQMQRAQVELQKAVELYPTNFQTYVYLGKYWLKAKNQNLAFNNFILAFYLGRFNWPNIMRSIKEDIVNLDFFSLDEIRREFKLITYPQEASFSFKKQGFIHKQIPLKIKVYVKKGAQEVSLYRNKDAYHSFHWLNSTQELDIYELILESFASNVYLDDFEIRTNPLTNIEKIEFIYKFYPPHRLQ